MRLINKIIILFIILNITSGCVSIPRKLAKPYTAYLPLIEKPISKKGIALTYGHCEDARMVGASWEYAWSPSPPVCYGVENTPMIWGIGDINSTVVSNSEWLMGFNEPDRPDQANISPDVAADAWRIIEGMYPNKKLVAPVPSTADRMWIVRFRDAYISKYGEPPRLNALAAHAYYGTVAETEELVTWYESKSIEWNTPGGVWVTEWAYLPCWMSYGEAISSMEQTVEWLENEPLVARYAWFAARLTGDEEWSFKPKSCLTNLNDFYTGKLTPLGVAYSKGK